jgi:hypothetical protein
MMGHIEDITDTKSTEALTDLLDAYCMVNSLPHLSADELLLETLEGMNQLKAQWQWLQAFITHWEIVQAEEDFEAACAARGEK